MKKLFEHVGGNKFKLSEAVVFTHDTTTDDGSEIKVKYHYYKASKGARERGSGLQLEPDEPASVEILSAQFDTGGKYELTDNEISRIENEIMDEMDDGDFDYDESDDNDDRSSYSDPHD